MDKNEIIAACTATIQEAIGCGIVAYRSEDDIAGLITLAVERGILYEGQPALEAAKHLFYLTLTEDEMIAIRERRGWASIAKPQ